MSEIQFGIMTVLAVLIIMSYGLTHEITKAKEEIQKNLEMIKSHLGIKE